MTKITNINAIKENDCKLNAEEYDNKKVTLKDIMGIISIPKIEGRFQEIVSTQKIKDTETGKEYDGFVDTELLILINEIDKENKQLHNK